MSYKRTRWLRAESCRSAFQQVHVGCVQDFLRQLDHPPFGCICLSMVHASKNKAAVSSHCIGMLLTNVTCTGPFLAISLPKGSQSMPLDQAVDYISNEQTSIDEFLQCLWDINSQRCCQQSCIPWAFIHFKTVVLFCICLRVGFIASTSDVTIVFLLFPHQLHTTARLKGYYVAPPSGDFTLCLMSE